MKKNLKVIQIKGIRGLILAGLVVICLAAGFIAFPGEHESESMFCLSSFSKKALPPDVDLARGIGVLSLPTPTPHSQSRTPPAALSCSLVSGLQTPLPSCP